MKKTLTTLIVLFALLLATLAIADYSIIDSATGAYINWDGTKYVFYDGSKNLMDLSDTEFDVSNIEQNVSGNTGYGMLKLYNGQGIGNGFSRIMWLETSSGIGTMRFTVPSGGVDTGAMLLRNNSLSLYTGDFNLNMGESPWSPILIVNNGHLELKENGTTMFDVQDGTIDLSGMVNNQKIKYAGNSYIEFDKGNERFEWKLGGASVMNLDDTLGLILSTGNYVNEFSTDGTLSGSSDNAVPTENATKTYIDTNFYPNTGGNIAGEVSITGISSDGTGKAVCIKSDGNLGTCTDAVNATGYCTCS